MTPLGVLGTLGGVWVPCGEKVLRQMGHGIELQPLIQTGSVFTDAPNSAQPC